MSAQLAWPAYRSRHGHTSGSVYMATMLGFGTVQPTHCDSTVLCSCHSGGFLFVEHPFFNLGVELSVPAVVTNPTLVAIQSAINAVAKQVRPVYHPCYTVSSGVGQPASLRSL